VTGGEEWRVRRALPLAIECYNQQTYPPERRELVVVSHWPQPLELPPNVRLVQAPPDSPLGHLRNLALQHVRGSYVIQWDDDDWHGPRRMELQILACLKNPDCATFLGCALAYDFPSDTAFVWVRTSLVHGSICHPVSPHQYQPSLHRSEDTAFLELWASRRVVIPDPLHYVYFSHGRNTWPSTHILGVYASAWGRGRWHLAPEDAALLRPIVERYRRELFSDSHG